MFYGTIIHISLLYVTMALSSCQMAAGELSVYQSASHGAGGRDI
jgi:hypothetical protein